MRDTVRILMNGCLLQVALSVVGWLLRIRNGVSGFHKRGSASSPALLEVTQSPELLERRLVELDGHLGSLYAACCGFFQVRSQVASENIGLGTVSLRQLFAFARVRDPPINFLAAQPRWGPTTLLVVLHADDILKLVVPGREDAEETSRGGPSGLAPQHSGLGFRGVHKAPQVPAFVRRGG